MLMPSTAASLQKALRNPKAVVLEGGGEWKWGRGGGGGRGSEKAALRPNNSGVFLSRKQFFGAPKAARGTPKSGIWGPEMRHSAPRNLGTPKFGQLEGQNRRPKTDSCHPKPGSPKLCDPKPWQLGPQKLTLPNLHPAPQSLHPGPKILHLKPQTSHPTPNPCTKNPKPGNPHPAPCTQYPKPHI